MAHTIQIKRFNAPGESPGTRGTTLAYGELAYNQAENLLWIGNDSAGEQIVSTGIVVGPTQPAVDPIAPGPLWFDTTGQVLYVWTGAGWSAAADVDVSSIPLGQLSDVDTNGAVSGDFLKYNGTVWEPDGIGSIAGHDDVVLTSPATNEVLTYNGTNWVNAAPTGGGGGDYAIDESSRTADGDWLTFYTSGGVDRMQFKTNGYAGNNPDWKGDNANYGGYQFAMASASNQQIIFEDSGNGVNLIGYHAETGSEEGLNIIGKGFSATGSTIRLITNNKTALQTTDGSIEMANLPTSDPGNTNEVWADNGVLVLSGSTAGGGAATFEKQYDYAGALVVSTGVKRLYLPRECTNLAVTGYVSSVSTGAAVGYDVRVNNAVVVSGTVPTSQSAGSEVTYSATMPKGAYVTVDITAAGTGAEDLALTLTFT